MFEHQGSASPVVRMGQWGRSCAGFLPSVGGLFVFWLFPFRPAVTVYVVIVGLGMVVHQVIEDAYLWRRIQKLVRGEVHGNDAR